MKHMHQTLAQDAEGQYLTLLRNLLEVGVPKGDRTGTGTVELFAPLLRIDLGAGFPLLTTKKMFHRGLVEELLWMMRGDTNNKSLQAKGVHIWDEWATKDQCARFGRIEGDLGPVYGHAWRRFGSFSAFAADQLEDGLDSVYNISHGVDQLSAALFLLRTFPDSRRILVSAWDPQHVEDVALPPCHTLFQFLTREVAGIRYLDCHLHQRSGDVFLGVPFNIASYALLTHIMARLAGMRPGTLSHVIISAHLYNTHRLQACEQLTRTPFNLPTLRIHTFERVSEEEIRSWSIDGFLARCHGAQDFEFIGYQSHPALKAEVAI